MFYIIFILLTMLGLLMIRGHKNTKQAVINHIDIHQAGRSEAEKNRQLNILHLSDLHLENISISPRQLYESVKDKNVDLIAITGDFMDRKRSIPKLIPYLEYLNKLQPVYGSYAVFGNHDYVLKDSYFTQLQELLHDHGVKTLQNEHDRIEIDGQAVNIIGIDDYGTGRSNLLKSYAGLEGGYNLVFTHDPNIVLDMDGYRFDYLLSGHFHGGQIHWPKPYHLIKMGKLVRMNMVKGLQKHMDQLFYISEGLGQTGVNIRVGSRPEITIHRIGLTQEQKDESVEIKAG